VANLHTNGHFVWFSLRSYTFFWSESVFHCCFVSHYKTLNYNEIDSNYSRWHLNFLVHPGASSFNNAFNFDVSMWLHLYGVPFFLYVGISYISSIVSYVHFNYTRIIQELSQHIPISVSFSHKLSIMLRKGVYIISMFISIFFIDLVKSTTCFLLAYKKTNKYM